jgi:hypothetical protein
MSDIKTPDNYYLTLCIKFIHIVYRNGKLIKTFVINIDG